MTATPLYPQIVVDFDSNQKTMVAGTDTTIRFYDKSYSVDGDYDSTDYVFVHTDGYDLGGLPLTIFPVNFRVRLYSTGTLPSAFNADTWYWVVAGSLAVRVSLTQGGDAIAWTNNGTGTYKLNMWVPTTVNGPIIQWVWYFGSDHTFTIAGGTPDLTVSNASTYFSINDRVLMTSTGALPTGLTTNTPYWIKTVSSTTITLSLTQGGSTVTYTNGTGSGVFSIYLGSVEQNPLVTFHGLSAGSYQVTLFANNSNNTGYLYKIHSTYLYVIGSESTKPTSSDIYGRVSIFLYNDTDATVINRSKSTGNSLFFKGLKVIGSMNKLGLATFTAYDTGVATATELGLLVADTNVAIIIGRDVVFSGKILRATKGKTSLFDTTSPFLSWSVEVESDISKMRMQNVSATNQNRYIAPPGYIVSKLVAADTASSIDWNGEVESSLITYEGASIPYRINDTNMYNQFITLANLVGFDWRTRNNFLKYSYGTGGWSSLTSNVTVTAIAPYTFNELAGRWVLFLKNNTTNQVLSYENGGKYKHIEPIYGSTVALSTALGANYGVGVLIDWTVTSGSWTAGTAVGTITVIPSTTFTTHAGATILDYIDGGTHSADFTGFSFVDKTVGVISYGKVVNNTDWVLTLSDVVNPTLPVSSDGQVIILGDPIIDFTSDLRQPTPIAEFTMNKSRSSSLHNGYEMNDKSEFKQISTKSNASGKGASQRSSTPDTYMQSVELSACNKYDEESMWFDNSTYISQKCEGYIHSHTSMTGIFHVVGWNYAFVDGDVFYVCMIQSDNTFTVGTATITSSTEGIEADGTLTTIFVTDYMPALDAAKGLCYIVGRKTYVKSTSKITQAGATTVVNIGACTTTRTYTNASTGLDPTFGHYLYLNATTDFDPNNDFPHPPGCIISNNTYSETAPQTNSPIDIFGLLRNSYVCDTQISMSDLEVYATNYLFNHCFYYKKGTFWCYVYDWFKTDIRPSSQLSEAGFIKEGDQITVLQNVGDASTDLEYNDYKNRWQVMEWSFDSETMKVTVQLGDFERNVNTLLNDKTTGINNTIT
jgi:hypothetical protein